MITFCSLAIYILQVVNVGPEVTDLDMHVLVIASWWNCSFTPLFAKNPRILLSIDINENCIFCRTIWFGNDVLDPSRLFIENDQIQHFISVSI